MRVHLAKLRWREELGDKQSEGMRANSNVDVNFLFHGEGRFADAMVRELRKRQSWLPLGNVVKPQKAQRITVKVGSGTIAGPDNTQTQLASFAESQAVDMN